MKTAAVLELDMANDWRDRAETARFELGSLMDGEDDQLAKLLRPIFDFLGEIRDTLT